MSKILNEAWNDASETWTEGSKIDRDYTADGDLKEFVVSIWDLGSLSWKQNSRSTYTYNANRQVLESTSQTWSTDEWINFLQYTYSYDAKDHLILLESKTWNSSKEAWELSNKTVYTNNSKGLVEEYTAQYLDASTSTWINSLREKTTYNSAGDVVVQTTAHWTDDAWLNSSSKSNSYNGQGYLVESFGQNWDSQTSAWFDVTRTTYVNNDDGSVQNYTVGYWNDISSSYENSSLSTFTYKANTSITETGSLEVSFFPNPSSGNRLHITCNKTTESTVHITDINGKTVLNTVLAGSAELNVAALPASLYLVRITNGNQVLVRSLVKQ